MALVTMRKLTRPLIYAFLKKYATNAIILDIGASGDDHREYFPNRTRLDINPSKDTDVIGDAHHLPFKEGSFEAVVCSEMLEHADDPQKVISGQSSLVVLTDSKGVIIALHPQKTMSDALTILSQNLDLADISRVVSNSD